MKRAKPRQHKRRLKSGKTITVNKGVRRSRKKSYGYMPMPKKKVSIEDKPIHSLTDEEFLQLVEKGNYSSSPFTKQEVPPVGTDAYEDFLWDNGYKTSPAHMFRNKKDFEAAEKKAKQLRKKADKKYNFGFSPMVNWDSGDEKFLKKLKSQIQTFQDKRIAASAKEELSDADRENIDDLDKTIRRKMKVLASMAARKDKTVPIQNRQRDEFRRLNERANMFAGPEMTDSKYIEREKEREERRANAKSLWVEGKRTELGEIPAPYQTSKWKGVKRKQLFEEPIISEGSSEDKKKSSIMTDIHRLQYTPSLDNSFSGELSPSQLKEMRRKINKSGLPKEDKKELRKTLLKNN